MAHGHNGGHGGGHGKKKGNSQLHHLLSFLDVGKPLQGKDLYKAAKAEAKITTKPQVDAYKRLAKQLKAQEKFDTRGLQRLGKKTAGAVGSVYSDLQKQAGNQIGNQQALSAQLSQQTANVGKQYGQALGQSQSAGLSDFLAQQQRQGTPTTSTAQQQLAQVVANQQQNAQAEANAQQAFAAQQGAANVGLARNMKTSAGLQGATAVGNIRSTVLSRIAAQKLQAQQDISEARGKAADARALKGSQIVQALQQLRGQEQQFKLGKQATAQRAAAAQLSAQTSIANSKRTAASSAASTAASIANSKRSARTSRKNNRRTNANSGSSGNSSHATKHAHQRAVQDFLATLQAGNQKKLHKLSKHQLIAYLTANKNESQSKSEVRTAVNKYLHGKGGHKKKGGHNPPPNAI